MNNFFYKKKILQRYLSTVLIYSTVLRETSFSSRLTTSASLLKKLSKQKSYRRPYCLINVFTKKPGLNHNLYVNLQILALAQLTSSYSENVTLKKLAYLKKFNTSISGWHNNRLCLVKAINVQLSRQILGTNHFKSQKSQLILLVNQMHLVELAVFFQTSFKEDGFKYSYTKINKLAFDIVLTSNKKIFSKREINIKSLNNVYAIFVRQMLTNTKFFFYLSDSKIVCPEIALFLKNLYYIYRFIKKIKHQSIYKNQKHVLKKVLLNLLNTSCFNSQKTILIKNVKIKPFNKQKSAVNERFSLFYFQLVRPLLLITRLETHYISEVLKLPVYPDKTNLQVQLLRNRIRRQLLPAIRILLNPQIDKVLCNFSESGYLLFWMP